jgi:hypothetical protein
MNIPLDLVHPALPFSRCPEAPAPGSRVQVHYYIVECRVVSGWEAPWFYVWNLEGTILSFCQDWRRMCHVLGWYPMPGLEPDQAIPRVGEARERRKPKTIVVERGQAEPLWLFGER